MTTPGAMRLIAIRGSHYCERARWALDLAGLPFEEDCYPPAFHMLATRPATGGKSTSVPVLFTRDSGVITDSGGILHYAQRCAEATSGNDPTRALAKDLYPADPALRAEVDRQEALYAGKLGAWVRVVCYNTLLRDSNMALNALCQGVPYSRALPFRALFWFPIRGMLIKGMRISPEHALTCLDKIRSLFEDVGEILAKNGGRFLVGNSFSAADLTFACMAALVVFPSEYGADLTALSKHKLGQAMVEELRAMPAGQHALSMYRLYRRQRPAVQAAGEVQGEEQLVGGTMD